MTAVTDALREMAAECEKALAVRKTTVGAKWCLERCRAALAAAEKDEGELVAALRDADEYLTYVEGKGEGGTTRFDVAAQAVRAILSKHATPEHAKKG